MQSELPSRLPSDEPQSAPPSTQPKAPIADEASSETSRASRYGRRKWPSDDEKIAAIVRNRDLLERVRREVLGDASPEGAQSYCFMVEAWHMLRWAFERLDRPMPQTRRFGDGGRAGEAAVTASDLRGDPAETTAN